MKVLSAAVLATLLSGCASESGWVELRSIDDIEDAFNRDEGRARVVLLLSPT